MLQDRIKQDVLKWQVQHHTSSQRLQLIGRTSKNKPLLNATQPLVNTFWKV